MHRGSADDFGIPVSPAASMTIYSSTSAPPHSPSDTMTRCLLSTAVLVAALSGPRVGCRTHPEPHKRGATTARTMVSPRSERPIRARDRAGVKGRLAIGGLTRKLEPSRRLDSDRRFVHEVLAARVRLFALRRLDGDGDDGLADRIHRPLAAVAHCQSDGEFVVRSLGVSPSPAGEEYAAHVIVVESGDGVQTVWIARRAFRCRRGSVTDLGVIAPTPGPLVRGRVVFVTAKSRAPPRHAPEWVMLDLTTPGGLRERVEIRADMPFVLRGLAARWDLDAKIGPSAVVATTTDGETIREVRLEVVLEDAAPPGARHEHGPSRPRAPP